MFRGILTLLKLTSVYLRYNPLEIFSSTRQMCRKDERMGTQWKKKKREIRLEMNPLNSLIE